MAEPPVDVTRAWWCAANLRLFDEDPGPRPVNVATLAEPRWVDRREHLVELYARQFLIECDADPDRVTAAAAGCRARERAERRWWTGTAVRWRLRPLEGDSWWHHAAQLMPWARADVARTWGFAAQIAETAAGWLDAADAAHDSRTRERLLVVHRHQLNADVLGALLPADMRAQQAAELAEDLRALDDDPPDRPGGPEQGTGRP